MEQNSSYSCFSFLTLKDIYNKYLDIGFFFSLYLFFYWKIVALQNFVVSCQTSTWISHQFSSVAQSYPAVCDPMDCSTPGLSVHHQLPGVYSNSCPLSRWCHSTISSFVVSFASCLQSFPASASFLMSQFFASGGQSIGVSALASVLPMNIQDWFPLGWTGWISLQSKGLSRSSPTPQFKSISSLVLSLLYDPTLTSIHDYWKNYSFDYTDLCWKSNVSVLC